MATPPPEAVAAPHELGALPRKAEPTWALTEEQQQAVARRAEPLLLSACAGSGKTSVLVERFVRAVREDGVAPASILVITFTERAAGELRERIRARLLELCERGAARDTEAAFVLTFHSFCARLLRSHALSAGVDPRFEILDEGFAARTRERAFGLALGDFVAGERTQAVDLLAAYGTDRVRSLLERAYGELRSRGHARPRLPAVSAAEGLDAEAAGACGLLDELLERFDRSYEALKRARGALDFDDLELLALALLEGQEGLRAGWSQRFELLMVDEFQDTNPRQLRILRALERGNLFTVGDELQSIYGFRDADVSMFRARRAELAEHGRSLELTRNFRARAPLVEVVNAVFEERLHGGYTPLVPGRAEFREVGGEGDGDPAVELLLTNRRGWNGDPQAEAGAARRDRGAGVPLWRQAEARMLAARVAELVRGGGVRAGEVVVLLRAVGDVEVYERALRDRGLPTLATVGGFWGRQQVGDLLAYLRALANPLDELAFYGVLASPLVGLSSDGLALLARTAQARGASVWATVQDAAEELEQRLPGPDGQALARFRTRFGHERRTAPRRTISQLIERAIAASGYRAHVLALQDGEQRMANVHKLLRLARRFEASEGRDLRGFLDHVAHLEELTSGPEPDAPVAGVGPDAVRLMSIHAAKGLEFAVVCVADLGRAVNLSVPDLLVDGERLGLRLLRLDSAEALPALEFVALCQERRRAQAEEEDRILYVAMTRARERLLLSGAADFERWPDAREGAPPIAWLGPALVGGLPELVRSFTGADGDPARQLAIAAAPGARVRCRLNGPGAQAGAEPAPGTAARRCSGERSAFTMPSADDPLLAGDPAVAQIDSLSYTTLGELERCGYRYYLERILGLEENRGAARGRASGERLDARARGTLVHRLLESLDFTRPRLPSAARVAAIARELGLRVPRSECEEIVALVRAASGVGKRGHRSRPSARVAAAGHVRREHPFAFVLGPEETLLSGVIDVLAREADGGYLVLDYKTDRVGSDVDLAALVEREYDLQRVLYALAVLRDGAPAVEVVHWFLQRPEEWAAARYTAADCARLETRLRTRIAHIRARGFAVSDHPHRGLCETCPGRSGLCSWSDAQTLREEPGRDDEPHAPGLPQVVNPESAR